MKKLPKLLMVFAFIILIYSVNQIYPNTRISPIPQITPIAISANVIKVIDGDSIQINTGEQVRLIGINAPEYGQCFWKESKEKIENLVIGKEIKFVKDISETDKYGRLLRFVYVDNVFINDSLVKNGYAKVMIIPPDTKYANEFINSENYAKENKLGLWGKCF